MNRVGKHFQVARIRQEKRFSRASGLSLEIAIPSASEIGLIPPQRALYLLLSCSMLDRGLNKDDWFLWRICSGGKYASIVLDLTLVENANAKGLRWLREISQLATANDITVSVLARPELRMILDLSGWDPQAFVTYESE